MKKVLFIYILTLLLFFTGCTNQPINPSIHQCVDLVWITDGSKCLDIATSKLVCAECGMVFDEKTEILDHDLQEQTILPTCTEEGYNIYTCNRCDYKLETPIAPLNHASCSYKIVHEALKDDLGVKQKVCDLCDVGFKKQAYCGNGPLNHGKLSVDGADLVDKDKEKVQLYGLSTHGLQWASRYVNFDTFDSIKNEFGINVIRLALYTSEGGYCTSTPAYKEFLYQKVIEGALACAKLDMYCIIDWHMVGATDDNDKNPLYYLDEAKEFFGRISSELKDYDHVLYEIMNEPCGDTTWNQCKIYAQNIIPVIRENTDAIILVGNPKWSSDLTSCLNDPLVGYDNIMYTYHFYASSHTSQATLSYAYTQGLPIFVSEHGGMGSDGDGSIKEESIKKWYDVLDKYNISYVAWNISNTGGSASIIKHGNDSLTDFSDDNLKAWGIYYKKITRTKAGFDE